MLVAPFPERESDRIAALRALGALDSAPDWELDTLVDTASAICRMPISLISLIDSDRQWLKANKGLTHITETPRDDAFCAHTILGDDVLEVRDARADIRFHDNPFVIGEPAIRFYAGVPLRLAVGLNVGSLCVIGQEPGELSDLQRTALRNLAGVATRLLEGRQALTELTRINQSLDASRSRFKALAESSPVGIYRIDADLNRTFVNQSWLDIWGRNEAEILGAGWRKYIHADDLKAAEAEFKNAVAEKRDIDNRYRILRPDGSVRHVHSKARPLLDDNGEIIDFIGTLEDVTDQIVARERHLIREQDLRRIYEATPVMMYSNDREHRIVAASDLLLEKIGYTREEVIGRQAIEFMSPASVRHVQAVTRPLFGKTGVVKNVELEMLTRSGETIDVLLSAILDDRNKDDRRPQTLAVMEDVTERHRAEHALQDALQRMQIATDSGGIGIWDWDLVGGQLFWDDWTRRVYGLQPGGQPITYEIFFRYVHPEDGDIIREGVRLAIADERPLDIVFRIIWDDGSLHYVKATGQVRRDEDGTAVRLVGANIDVTEQRSLAAALSAQHELLRVTLNSIGDAVISTDKSGAIVWLNPVAERMTGWSANEAVGRPLVQVFNIVGEATRAPCQDPAALCLATGHVTGLANNTVLIARDGSEYGIEDSAAPIRDGAGELLGVVLVFHDVTEQRRLSSEMSYRASHDALTGLVNRAEFEVRLRRALRRTQDECCEHSLIYLDLDQFKVVNDTCGHAIGDLLLQQVAKLFRDTVRDSDTVGRLGGDEFAIILEFCPPDKARRIAQGICDRMNEFRFVHDGRRFRIGTSIGVVPVDSRWSTIAAVMQAADSACYAAKEAGRNRVHIWHDSDAVIRSRLDEMQWTTLIEQALDDDGFVLYAQRIEPIMRTIEAPSEPPSAAAIAAGSPIAGSEGVLAEILVRMRRPDGSIVLPGQFLAAAERFHLVSRVDRWVVNAAINWMKSATRLDEIETLSVNLSGQTVGDRACHRWIIDQVTSAGPDVARRLCFEITETAVITNMVDAVLFVEQLRGIGVKVALDDFGAGASSFGYLKQLKVDTLKIDGQFIEKVNSDALDDAAVRCFADVARVTNMKTVAEWVETQATLKRLAEIGIDYAQGFLLNPPRPIDELLRAG